MCIIKRCTNVFIYLCMHAHVCTHNICMYAHTHTHMHIMPPWSKLVKASLCYSLNKKRRFEFESRRWLSQSILQYNRFGIPTVSFEQKNFIFIKHTFLFRIHLLITIHVQHWARMNKNGTCTGSIQHTFRKIVHSSGHALLYHIIMHLNFLINGAVRIRFSLSCSNLSVEILAKECVHS